MVRSREAVPGGRPRKSGMRSGRGAVALAAAAGLVVTLGVPASASAASLRARDVQRAHASSSSTFVVGDTSSVQKLDPDVVTNFLDFQALGLIYDQLVQYNNKLQLVPDLATSWSYSDGNRLLTFQLRKGVTFDDGSSFTSANVVASLDRALAPKTGDASASFLANVKKIVPTGTYTVQFQLSQPDTSILDGLTSVNLSMLSTKAITAGTLAKTPDGTGPFEFSSWSPGNTFVMKANPGYWGGKVTLGSVKIETIPSEQSIASAVEANTVQLGLLTEPQVATHLPSSLKVQSVLDLTYRALMLQDKTGPLANVDNRLAIACAVNRKQVLEDAVFGAGQVVRARTVGPIRLQPGLGRLPDAQCSHGQELSAESGQREGLLVHGRDVDRP